MDNLVTIESILAYLKNAVEQKLPLRPADWLEAATRLCILLQDLDESISELSGAMADHEVELIKEGRPAAQANILKREAIGYTDYLKKIAMQKRCIELIRLAKKQVEVREL